MKDLLVVGGGPAGLASALYAARAGLEVTVWDKRAGALDKACGEGLMPGAVAALADLGVALHGADIGGIRYLAGRHAAEARFPAGPGRGVRRTVLHDALRTATQGAAVPIEQRTVREVAPHGDHVVVDGQRFRTVIAADGLHSPVRRQLGLDARPSARRRFGLRRHFRCRPWTDLVEVHWSPTAEAYVTPVADELVGVAVLTSARGSFEHHLDRFPALRSQLAGAGPASAVRGAGPLRQRARSRVAGRVLLVGDASGYVDALTGEGISMGLAQARAAVAAIAADDPQRYERQWRAITWRYRLLTAGLLHATRLPPVRRGLVPAAERLPAVFSAAVNTLARPA